MPLSLTMKLIDAHRIGPPVAPGDEVGLRIEQALLQDALGTLIMLELEALETDRAKVEVAVQYVDHNLLEASHFNAEEHLFLRSACRRFGLWYSGPGNGISHPTHMQRFGKPGASLVGGDSHTPAAGSLGMLAFGAGGMDVALAVSGEPLHLPMPETWGVKLTGQLPDWVSAKDVILELLRRHGVSGGSGRIVEYYGAGLAGLTAMDRHVIANQGAELGATTTVFPSDDRTREFLRQVGREGDWRPLTADEGASYDHHDEIDLHALEPLIAKPSSPGNVVRVRDVAKEDIYQSYIGSSANPGYRDYAMGAMMVAGRKVHERVSFDINPSTRQVLQALIQNGRLAELVEAGARIHQPGCNGCIGMGQAPAVGRNSLRTVPRNFPGRSGTPEDRVFLCSPETAAASALTGVITDPRDLGLAYPHVTEPEGPSADISIFEPPIPEAQAHATKLEKTANIVSLPDFKAPGDDLRASVLLKLKDDVSTDEITPANAQTVPRASNIPALAEYAFHDTNPDYARKAAEMNGHGVFHAIVAGDNYGQGSSREHSVVAPRFLGLGLVVAKSFARIHWQNLINFGVLPLTFSDANAYEQLKVGDKITIEKLAEALSSGGEIEASVEGRKDKIRLVHTLSKRQVAIIEAGGVINQRRAQAS